MKFSPGVHHLHQTNEVDMSTKVVKRNEMPDYQEAECSNIQEKVNVDETRETEGKEKEKLDDENQNAVRSGVEDEKSQLDVVDISDAEEEIVEKEKEGILKYAKMINGTVHWPIDQLVAQGKDDKRWINLMSLREIVGTHFNEDNFYKYLEEEIDNPQIKVQWVSIENGGNINKHIANFLNKEVVTAALKDPKLI